MNLLDMEEGEIRRALRDGRIKVSVYGLGHVGSPILAAWLQAGASGIGVDVDEGKVLKLSRGESPVDEPCLTDVFRKALNEGRLKATSDGEWASRETHVKIIAVPTLIDGEGNPKLDAIRSAAKSIASGLKEGNLVILESSVPPGTTRGVLKPILEELSGLQAGEDFGLAYSPERISEGRALRDIVESYPKVVGGIDAKSTEVAANLYSLVVKRGVIKLSSDLAAELEKLAEGIYRDVNIALANEIAALCRGLGVDYDEVRLAANSQPYSHLHRPGTGVGGLCIPVYPRFLIWKAKDLDMELPLTAIARTINENMPAEVSSLVGEGMKRLGISNPKLAILGLAFRGDVPDSRLSPTYDLINHLLSMGVREIVVHDPIIREDAKLDEMGVPLTNDLIEALGRADIAVISTDHSAYRMKSSELFQLSNKLRLIVDGRHVIEVDSLPSGVLYVGVGRPWREG